MIRAMLLAALAGASFGVAAALFIRPGLARADEPSAEITALRSQVASLTAALYVADQQACLNVGVHPVPPPARKGGRR